MQLENWFTVPVPVEDAWRVLLDVERVAPCMPGASLDSVDGEEFTGRVKVKVGPIMLTYKGTARFVDRDDEGHSVVIEASGKETRGPGTARATVLTRLEDRGHETNVLVTTDLAVTGRPAQFGRGVMAEVSAKLIDQFAACLAHEVTVGAAVAEGAAATAGAAAPGAPAAPPLPATGAPQEPSPAPAAPVEAAAAPRTGEDRHDHEHHLHLPPRPHVAEAIDVFETAGLPIAKRLVPVVAVLVAVWLLLRAARRRG